MKALFVLFLVLFVYITQAQYNPDAPWMRQLGDAKAKTSSKNKYTFKDVVTAFDAYWLDRDANKKGSGHKPFKRWETYWASFIKDDGTLPTPNEMWQVWQEKQQFAKINMLTDQSNWQPLGPFNHTNTGSWSSGQGRINAIAVDPQVATTYYAGAPAGGIWKSTNSGNSWTPLSDDLPQIGVSGIAIDHSNSDIIYIATGDDDYIDSYSVGVMKSIDGGLNWSTTGLNTSPGHPNNMNDIYMHPSNTSVLWVATNNGVYKTTDAGTTWSNANGTSGLNIKDIKLKPNDPNTIYAVTANTLYVSIDGGTTFTNTGFGIGLPASSSRLVIDVTPANGNVIYVFSALNDSFQGLYKSSDSGVNFTQTQANVPMDADLFDGSKQAWFDMALAVSDINENEVYTGVLNIWKSIDGGENFSKVNEWYLPNSASYSHADIHLLRFFNGVLFAGTDGGFYKTSDGGINFTDLTAGLQIGQFYRLSVSKESSQKMVGGLQDNGGYALNNFWQVYYGADGMDTAIQPDNSNTIYGFIQFGSNLYISNSSGASNDLYASIPDEEIDTDNGDNGGNWITPLVINRDGELYAGYSSLYQLGSTRWSKVSSSFGPNINIDVLEIDEVDPNNIYVALDKVLHKSVDKGINFLSVYKFLNNISSIEVNNHDSDIIYVTTSGNSGKVYRSIDGGSSFTDITGSLPGITKNVIKHQNLHNDNPLFLGTSLGVYRYDDAIGDWEPFETNLPNVAVRDLEINLNDGNITAATYGRGIWQSDIPLNNPSNEISLEKISNVKGIISCGSVESATIEVRNRGANNIQTVQVSYTINGNTNNFVWNSGTILPNTTQEIEIPAFNLGNDSFQELEINAAISNDTFEGNNSLTTYLFSNDSGTFNSVNNFELASDTLLVVDDNSSLPGYWERGVATGALLNTEALGNHVYGTNLSGTYGNNIKSYLVTKCYDLSVLSNPILKFKMAFDLELNYDILYVEYTTDSGLNWQVLGTANDLNWYNSDRTPGSDCYNCVGAQWTGTDASLKEYSYDLSALNSETNISFRFVFHSDKFTVNEGVIIDNLSLEGTLDISEFDAKVFRIYPNPSTGIFNITAKAMDRFDYQITDITGKTILGARNIETRNQLHSLDLSGLQSGIYFITLRSGLQETIKKLVLK